LYSTQITLHGKLPDITCKKDALGYCSIVVNQNNTIGIKYSAIDALKKKQIAKAIELWNGIIDTKKICLNLYADRIGKRCWTNIYPVDKGNVWQTGWVDMCFLCEEKFFTELGTIPPRHVGNRGSSGVGAYISRRMVKLKLNMYQVKESLVTVQPEHHKSQMHHG
jgi:hypothetical protein